jgi:hypothetical protein
MNLNNNQLKSKDMFNDNTVRRQDDKNNPNTIIRNCEYHSWIFKTEFTFSSICLECARVQRTSIENFES